MLMIRTLKLRHRLRNVGHGAREFMARYDHFGEQIEAPESACSAGPHAGPSSAKLKELLKARRARANFFGAHLFCDPAWDILLLAYVALLDEEPLLISTLLRTSLAPATTMLRWVKALEHEGWLQQTCDPPDGPRSFLTLSAAGKAGMERYLTAVWPSLPL
jgi:hypothetical protein